MGLLDEIETFAGFAPAPMMADVAPPVEDDAPSVAVEAGTLVDTTATMAHAVQQSKLATSPGWTTLNIQQDLNKLGASPQLAEDNVPGAKTTAAIKAFQSSHGLSVDGLIGPATEAAIVSALGGMAQVFVPTPLSAPSAPAAPSTPSKPAAVVPGATPAAPVKKPISKAAILGGGALALVGAIAAATGAGKR